MAIISFALAYWGHRQHRIVLQCCALTIAFYFDGALLAALLILKPFADLYGILS